MTDREANRWVTLWGIGLCLVAVASVFVFGGGGPSPVAEPLAIPAAERIETPAPAEAQPGLEPTAVEEAADLPGHRLGLPRAA